MAVRARTRLKKKTPVRRPEIYVSTDVEADGPIPGICSMLSFGSAAFLPGKGMIDTFSANLKRLPGATQDTRTMKWWKTQPEAWIACRRNTRDPKAVMSDYVAWLQQLPGEPVFVAYPASFDFMFVYWYLIRFAGESPFSYTALDIKSYAMAVLRKEFRDVYKKNMPKRWFVMNRKSHVAVEDAIEQGLLFCNMMAERRDTKG